MGAVEKMRKSRLARNYTMTISIDSERHFLVLFQKSGPSYSPARLTISQVVSLGENQVMGRRCKERGAKMVRQIRPRLIWRQTNPKM